MGKRKVWRKRVRKRKGPSRVRTRRKHPLPEKSWQHRMLKAFKRKLLGR